MLRISRNRGSNEGSLNVSCCFPLLDLDGKRGRFDRQGRRTALHLIDRVACSSRTSTKPCTTALFAGTDLAISTAGKTIP